MRISDIVRQLRTIFPKYSNVLSDTKTGFASTTGVTLYVATKSAVPHGLSAGDPVVLHSCRRLVYIADVTPGPSGTYYIETQSDHDLSEGWHSTVLFDQFYDPDWDGEHPLVGVKSGTVFQIGGNLPPPPPLQGFEELLIARPTDGIDGYHSVLLTTSASQFYLNNSGGLIAEGNYPIVKIATNIRIAGVVDIGRAIEQYTKQDIDDAWAFVVPNDVDVSKDMHTSSDATATMMRGSEEFRLRVIDGFTIYLVKSTKHDIGGVATVDLFRHDLMLPILKSVCGVKFPAGLSTGPDFRTVLRGHGVAQYNRAYLVYAYDFEQPADIVGSDTAYDDDTRAFRELNYIHRVGGVDTEDAEAHIFFDDYI